MFRIHMSFRPGNEYILTTIYEGGGIDGDRLLPHTNAHLTLHSTSQLYDPKLNLLLENLDVEEYRLTIDDQSPTWVDIN